MKYALFVLTIFFLIACSEPKKESIDNVSVLNEASTKLKILNLYPETIYDLNKKVQIKFGNDSANFAIFKRFDDTLSLIRSELIESTGGYTRLGEYINAPAIEDVHAYFYEESKGSQFFFNSLNQFNTELSIIFPESSFMQELDQKFNILIKMYGLKSREMIFNNLSIGEAVILLESIRSRVALEQTNYLLLRVKE